MQTAYPVELSIECIDIIAARSRSLLGRRAKFPRELRPFVVFFFRQDAAEAVGGSGDSIPLGKMLQWQLIGRSETVICDEYVRFVAKVKLAVPTTVDRAKEVRVELFNQLTPTNVLGEQQFLGAAESTIDAITSAPLFRREVPMMTSRDLESCTLVLSADIIRPSIVPSRASINIDFASITKGAARCFYVISRQLPSADFTPIYRSEILEHDQKRFASMTRLVDALTAGVNDKLLRIEFYQVVSRGSKCLKLGFLQTSFTKLKATRCNQGLPWWPAPNVLKHSDFVEIGRVVLLDSRIEEGHCGFILRVTA